MLKPVVLALVLGLLASGASARGLLLNGSGAPAPTVSIIDIQPHSATISTNVASGTTVTTFTCIMSDHSTCPPPGAGYVWSMANQPPFVGLNQSTGALTTTRALSYGDACTPAQDSCTFPVTIGPPPPITIVSISPSVLFISDQATLGTQYPFTCATNDNSPCTGRIWTFTNLPSFLTSGSNSAGGYVQTTQAPPLPDGSGTFSVTAQ